MDAKLIAQGIIDGLASIPEGLYLSGVRTFEGSGLLGRDLKARNEYETERFMRVFKGLISNEEPIRQLITIVITDFYSKLDENGKKVINDKIGYSDAKLGSRTGAQFYLTRLLADKMIARVKTSQLGGYLLRGASTLTFNVIMIQGIIEEAARASRRMGQKYASTYMKVSPMNLDMVYFLVEKPLEPYLMYIHSHPMQCKGIQNEICKILAK
ncbi:hypothetical protein ACQYRI_14030 [Salmonella enterica]